MGIIIILILVIGLILGALSYHIVIERDPIKVYLVSKEHLTLAWTIAPMDRIIEQWNKRDSLERISHRLLFHLVQVLRAHGRW